MHEKRPFNRSIYPKKLLNKLRWQIAIQGYIASGFGPSEEDEILYDEFEEKSAELKKQYRALCKKIDSNTSDWETFNKIINAHIKLYSKCVDEALETIIHYAFELAETDEEKTVSTRNRIEREKLIRDRKYEGLDTKHLGWKNLSLEKYAPVFMRWLANSWNESKTEWDWEEEDWDSDIQYAMCGYFLAKNKQNGSGFDIFGMKTIEEAKALAEPHIPREGLDIFINTFDAAGYDRSTLPEAWQRDAKFTIDFESMHVVYPQFEIKEANEDYLIIHVQSMDAAIALGYGTSWCTSDPPNSGNAFEDYSDALIMICDKNGQRFQIHLGSDQFHNEADNSVDVMQLCDDYEELLPIMFTLSSEGARREIPNHVRGPHFHEKTVYEVYKDNFIRISNERLKQGLQEKDSDKLCHLFNAISGIGIAIQGDIWLSLSKKSIQKAIEIIPDIELSIQYFIDTYWDIGEDGRDYLAKAGLLSQYQEWLLRQSQTALPKSINKALNLG